MVSNNYNLVIKVGVGLFFSLLFLVPAAVNANAISAQTILQLENAERLKKNLNVLVENKTLTEVAQTRANDMADNNYFAHRSPDGSMAWDIALEKNYDYKFIGENLAIDWKNSEDLVQAWLDSQSHRENIISANYLETGIATAKSDTSLVVVQIFGQRFDNSRQYQPPAVKLNVENPIINVPDTQPKSALPGTETAPAIIPNFEYLENLICPVYPMSFTASNKFSQSILGAQSAENIIRHEPDAKLKDNYWIFLLMISSFPMAIALTLLKELRPAVN